MEEKSVAEISNHETKQSKLNKFLDLVFWTPPQCRWKPENPPRFTIWHNLLFAFAGGFTSANLFYSAPILNILAEEFNVSESGVANIPTLAQAGNATCLLFILPLADFFPRRRFLLTLVALTAIFWIPLCMTRSFGAFVAFTYLSAIFTGGCGILLPLVAELSSPEKRAFNISVVATGPTFGILLARILSGIVANYTAWRNVYWMSLGLQTCVLLALWLFMPDYPAINSWSTRKIVKTYPKILWSIVTLYTKHPALVQASLLSFCTFFTVASYWTTLTFLLTGPIYRYNSAFVGLFGLIGAATIVLGPLFGKFVIQPLREPAFSTLVGKTVSLTGIVIGTYAGTHCVAAPVIQAVLLDAGLMIVSISNRVSISTVEPLSRNRVNTAYVLILYAGQLVGTKAGSDVYEKYGGWVPAGSLSVGIILFSYFIVIARGPYEKGWIGWSGGWRLRRRELSEDTSEQQDNNLADPEKLQRCGSMAENPVEPVQAKTGSM